MKIVTIDGKRVCGVWIPSKRAYCEMKPDHKSKNHRVHTPPKRSRRYKKRCSDCGELKRSTEYYRNANAGDGLDGYCKPCRKARGIAAAKARGPGHCMYPDCHRERYQHDSLTYDAYCKQHRDLASYGHEVVKARRAEEAAWAAYEAQR